MWIKQNEVFTERNDHVSTKKEYTEKKELSKAGFTVYRNTLLAFDQQNNDLATKKSDFISQITVGKNCNEVGL